MIGLIGPGLDRDQVRSSQTVSVHVTTRSSIERCAQAFCINVSGGQEELRSISELRPACSHVSLGSFKIHFAMRFGEDR